MNTYRNIRLGERLRLPRLSLALLAAALATTVLNLQAGVIFTNLYSFTGISDGQFPAAGLIQGSDGNFYGTTAGIGTTDYGAEFGAVFKISASGLFTNLYSFTGYNDAVWPYAGLVQASDGCFYGTTSAGGSNSFGTVFRISANGAYTNLYSFTGLNDGAGPDAGLIQGSDGYLYGTTFEGGSNFLGVVFKISTNGALISLYSFTGGNDGKWPVDGLAFGSDGYFYGTTLAGGTNTNGTVFKISASGAFTSLYSFTGGSDGSKPQAGLVQGNDSNFYGTTYEGGTNGDGTVFKISASGAFTSLHSFTGGSDGSEPPAGLILGSDGNFYGTTRYGGANNAGAVFKIGASGAFTNLYSFTGGNDGAYPRAELVQGNDGNFYGTTFQGGAGSNGVVFRLSVGLPPLNAVSIPMDAAFGFTNGFFGFNVSGPAGSNVVIESSPDLQNWIPLQTNLMAGGLFYFSDPQSSTNGRQFYRAVLP